MRTLSLSHAELSFIIALVRKGAGEHPAGSQILAMLEHELSASTPDDWVPDYGRREPRVKEVELAYRRGYHQGAYVAIDAIRRGVPPADVKKWAINDLFDWRASARGLPLRVTKAEDPPQLRPASGRYSPRPMYPHGPIAASKHYSDEPDVKR